MSDKQTLGILFVALTLCGQAWAGPAEDADAAFKRGDYATAMRLFRPLAEQGNTDSQTMLGVMYDDGLGVPKDRAEAVKWYRLVADKFRGAYVQQFRLGEIYANGLDVPQDYAEAVKWYRLAADNGYPEAQYNFGTMYSNGQGVPQDYVQAHKWYNLAASRFPASEKENRNRAVYMRDFVAAKMTPAQIAEAQKLAREWKAK